MNSIDWIDSINWVGDIGFGGIEAVGSVWDIWQDKEEVALLNVCAEPEFSFYDTSRFKHYLCNGFYDILPYPYEKIYENVKWIDTQIKSNRKVLVHCAGSNCRSVTVVLCYYIWSGMKDLKGLADRIVAMKPFKTLYGIPTKDPMVIQHMYLSDWARWLESRK